MPEDPYRARAELRAAISRGRHPAWARKATEEHLLALGACAVAFGAMEDALNALTALLINPRNPSVPALALERDTVRSQLSRILRTAKARQLDENLTAGLKEWSKGVSEAATLRNDLLHGVTYPGVSKEAEVVIFKMRGGRSWDYPVESIEKIADIFSDLAQEGWKGSRVARRFGHRSGYLEPVTSIAANGLLERDR